MPFKAMLRNDLERQKPHVIRLENRVGLKENER